MTPASTPSASPAWHLPDPAPEPTELASELLTWLTSQASSDNVAGMARYGISTAGTLGVPMSVTRPMARTLRPLARRDPEAIHAVAGLLWASGVHEARILAGLIDIPTLVTREQCEEWVSEIDSWDVCDQVCDLFAATPFADDLVRAWTGRPETFPKRAGFVVITTLAVRAKASPDERLIGFLPLAAGEADDDRTLVKKAISWAIRQVGKRSTACHAAAIDTAEEILARYPDARAARWVARDALRELRSEKVLARISADPRKAPR